MDEPKDKKSKYSLKLRPVDGMTKSQCVAEVSKLTDEYHQLQLTCEKTSDTYPLIRELVMTRINSVHNRLCFLNAKGIEK